MNPHNPQPDLFEPHRARRSSQAENIERVRSKIAGAVLDFVEQRAVVGPFRARDLYDHCEPLGIAPASADRILRLLRREGRYDYVVDRSASLYTITAIY